MPTEEPVKLIKCASYGSTCAGSLCPDVTDCDEHHRFCFATWTNDTEGVKFVYKGCWTGSQCISEKCEQAPTAAKDKNVFFCCCIEDMCNVEVEFKGILPPTTTPTSTGE